METIKKQDETENKGLGEEQEMWNDVIHIVGISDYLNKGNDHYDALISILKHYFTIIRKK